MCRQLWHAQCCGQCSGITGLAACLIPDLLVAPAPRKLVDKNVESSIILIKYFPPLAKHRPYHQQPKHTALVPPPAVKVYIRFQLCRRLSRAYRDREPREMGDAHPVLLHLLGLTRPGFPPTPPPCTTSLWAPDEDGEGGGPPPCSPGVSAEIVLWPAEYGDGWVSPHLPQKLFLQRPLLLAQPLKAEVIGA